MGTTKDALTADDGVAYDVIIAIEGYQYLLTTGSTSAAITAWNGTDWVAALGGLSVQWSLQSALHPWEPFKSGQSRLTFTVADVDGNDTFGTDTNRKEGGDATLLATSIDRNDTSVVTLRSDDFDSAGALYMGCETIAYLTNTTATETFSNCTRGTWSPFTTEGAARYSRSHRITSTVPGVNVAPIVRSIPTEWVGRWLGVYLHRRAGTTLDTVAQAHLAFAGRIASIRDSEDSQTVVECESIMKTIEDTVIFREPWKAKAKEGIYLRAGMQLYCTSARTPIGVGSSTGGVADTLSVVPSGAAAPYEIDEGFYTAGELQIAINDWLSAATAATDLIFSINFAIYKTTPAGDIRSAIGWSDSSAGSAIRYGKLSTNSSEIAWFMGWDQLQLEYGSDPSNFSLQAGTNYSASEPFRLSALVLGETVTLEIEDATGSWFDQQAYVPNALGSAGFTHGIVKMAGAYYLAGNPTSTTIDVRRLDALNQLAQIESPAVVRASGSGEIQIQQVLVLEGSFYGLFLAMLLSTGTASFNSSTWDLFPDHCAVGLPYSLVTSSFESELAAAPFAGMQRTIFIEKPTPFAELFEWAFTLRHIQLVWGDARLSLTGWATPTTGATLTATEATKAVPVGQKDSQFAASVQSDEWMRNVLKVDYDRELFTDKYRSSYTVNHIYSVDANGSKAITIKARDAVIGLGLLGEDLSALMPGFIAGLQFLTRPVSIVQVPVSFNQFITHRPGQAVLFSDNFTRDPTTGTRGISGKPALIVGAWYDWGGGRNNGSAKAPQGELTLMLFPGRQVAPYAPSGEVDETYTSGDFAGGYNSVTGTIRLKAHAYSESSDGTDASQFDQSDAIVIVERDPSNSGSPDSWTRTISSKSGNDLTLSSGLSAPAFDSTKKYRIFSQAYTSAQTTQKTDCYQADDADGTIQDTRDAYAYGFFGAGQVSTFTASAATDLPERHVTLAYGDGKALDTGNAFVIARNLNNLISYKTSPQAPTVNSDTSAFGAPAGSPTWKLARIEIVHFGKGIPTPTATGTVQTRNLYFAPIFASSDGSTANVRVSLCRDLPGTSVTGCYDVTRPTPYLDNTFTTTSTTDVFPAAIGLSISHLRQGDESMGGYGYLLIEVSSKAVYRGMGECWVGPLEAA